MDEDEEMDDKKDDDNDDIRVLKNCFPIELLCHEIDTSELE